MIVKPLIRVLHVDDDDDHALLVREALAGNSRFTLRRAADLRTGLQVLAGGNIDAVLLDLGLPDSIGMDGLKSVRTRFPEVPVLVLTGWDDPDVCRNVLALGAIGWIVKDGKLVESVRKVMESLPTTTRDTGNRPVGRTTT